MDNCKEDTNLFHILEILWFCAKNAKLRYLSQRRSGFVEKIPDPSYFSKRKKVFQAKRATVH